MTCIVTERATSKREAKKVLEDMMPLSNFTSCNWVHLPLNLHGKNVCKIYLSASSFSTFNHSSWTKTLFDFVKYYMIKKNHHIGPKIKLTNYGTSTGFPPIREIREIPILKRFPIRQKQGVFSQNQGEMGEFHEIKKWEPWSSAKVRKQIR